MYVCMHVPSIDRKSSIMCLKMNMKYQCLKMNMKYQCLKMNMKYQCLKMNTFSTVVLRLIWNQVASRYAIHDTKAELSGAMR